MTSDMVHVQPHRRSLSKSRVEELARTMRRHHPIGESFGAAVAYRPSVGYVLLAGEHRYAAASAPGGKTEVIILTSWDDLVAWMAVDSSDPRGLGWDPVAAVYFYEKAVAALKPGRADQPLADVAEFVGINRGVLESVRWGRALIADVDQPQDVRDYTQSLLDALERGEEGGHSVRERVARFVAKKANKGRPPQSAAVQRKALESIAHVEGIIAALAEMGPVNPEIPAKERTDAADRLGSLGAQLSKIKRNLRGES